MISIRMITVVMVATISIRRSGIMAMVSSMPDGSIIPVAASDIHTVINIDIGITTIVITTADIIAAIIIISSIGSVSCSSLVTSTCFVTRIRGAGSISGRRCGACFISGRRCGTCSIPC